MEADVRGFGTLHTHARTIIITEQPDVVFVDMWMSGYFNHSFAP